MLVERKYSLFYDEYKCVRSNYHYHIQMNKQYLHCRYNEGLVDIMASSIEMVGSPRVMFTDAKTSTPVRYAFLPMFIPMDFILLLDIICSRGPGKCGKVKEIRKHLPVFDA